MRSLLPILFKEFRHIGRDRRSLAAAILMPLMMLLLFGYAISMDLRTISVALVDRDRTPSSRTLVADLTADGTVRVLARPDDEKALEDLLDRGEARVGFVIPPGYGRDLAAGRPAPLQVLVDGTEATFAAQALSQMLSSVQDAMMRRMEDQVRLVGSKEPLPTLTTRTRVFFNEPLNSQWAIVPGLIAIVLMQLAALLTSQCVAREYERNTIEQVLVSPVNGPALMVGKLIPYVCVGVVQVSLVTACSRLLFHVPIRGSLGLLALGTVLYLTGAMALGQFFSAALKSQQVAMQVSLIVTMLPSILLSGFIFPIENMPEWLQVVTYIVPARYYIGITRGLFLKGVGLDVLWSDFIAMAIFATVILLASITRFRTRLS